MDEVNIAPQKRNTDYFHLQLWQKKDKKDIRGAELLKITVTPKLDK